MPPKLWGDSCFQKFGSNLCLNLPHIIHHQIFYQVQSPQHHTYQLAWSCQDSPAFCLSVPRKLCPRIIAQSSLWLPWPSTPTKIGCVHSSFICKSCNVSFICKSPPTPRQFSKRLSVWVAEQLGPELLLEQYWEEEAVSEKAGGRWKSEMLLILTQYTCTVHADTWALGVLWEVGALTS